MNTWSLWNADRSTCSVTLRLSSLLLVVCAILLTGGCVERSGALALEVDEQTLTTLASTDRDTTIILVYSPDDCFSCGGEYTVWRRLQDDGRADLRLVLTRTPTDGELRRIRLARINVAASWRGNTARPSLPRVYLLARGSVRDSAIGPFEQASLVRKLLPASLGDSLVDR